MRQAYEIIELLVINALSKNCMLHLFFLFNASVIIT